MKKEDRKAARNNVQNIGRQRYKMTENKGVI